MNPGSSRSKGLLQFLLSIKQPNGSFSVHEGGEIDVRYVKYNGGVFERQILIYQS